MRLVSLPAAAAAKGIPDALKASPGRSAVRVCARVLTVSLFDARRHSCRQTTRWCGKPRWWAPCSPART